MKRKPTERNGSNRNEAQELLEIHLGELGLRYEMEFKFYSERRWKMDAALPGLKIGIEIEGGAFTQGRHTRGTGFIKDMEKYNHAALLGWRVLRFVPSQVLDGTAIAFIKKVLRVRERGFFARRSTHDIER